MLLAGLLINVKLRYLPLFHIPKSGEIDMPFFKTDDGCSLFYEFLETTRTRPVLALLNGTLQTTLNWKTVARSLAAHFNILLYDARGQGQSELGGKPLSLQLHLEDLEALLDHLSLERVNLVGLSHGAYVALAFAVGRPARTSRIVLCSTGAGASFRARMIVRSWHEILKACSLEAMVWAALPHVFGQGYLRRNEKMLPQVAKTIVRRNRQENLKAHLEAMAAYPSMTRLMRRTDCPVLVMTGSDDPLVSQEGAARLAAACGGRHYRIADCGHSLPIEAPDHFTRTIVSFCTSKQKRLT